VSNQGNFAGFNAGIISNCYSVAKGKNLDFVGNNVGKIFASYGNPKEAKNINLDNEIWQKGDSKKRPYKFIPHLWQKSQDVTNPIKISNAKQLINFAQRVNNGDASAQNAEVKLTKNINLHNRKWAPIGKLISAPFTGSIDGAGHKVYGLNINGNEPSNAAFFGFNEGKISNLIVDIKIKNAETSAGFVANNSGIIESCGVVAKIKSKSKNLGGFVAENSGTINRCYAAGKIYSFSLSKWLWLIPIIILLILPEVFSRQLPYKSVPFDNTQVVSTDSATSSQGNFVSFQFNTEATIDCSKGTCTIQYVNAADSDKNVVLEVQITDADCYAATGVMDKSPDQLQALADAGNYDPNNSWTTIAQSGALHPGATLENAKITKLYNGAYLPAGNYQGRAHLIYYNVNTGAREIVENSFAINIKVI